MSRLDRRELITAILGASTASMIGCERSSLSHLDRNERGELLAPNFALGHRVRDFDRSAIATEKRRTEKTKIVIVGAGIAGLSTAWQLSRAGMDDYVVLELDPAAGGTARSGHVGNFRFPWGAHYVPVPMAENAQLIELFREMEVITGIDDAGDPIVAEQFLCREPEERVFHQGQWHQGLYPYQDATDEDLRQLADFRSLVDQWVSQRDEDGRRMFAIPTSHASVDPSVMALDTESMGDWMRSHALNSPRLQWLLDYCCRDDYGVDRNEASAWAGLFYFASRQRHVGGPSQEVMTWPQGNGRIAQHLVDRIGGRDPSGRLRTGQAVVSINTVSGGGVEVDVFNEGSGLMDRIKAERVIFAAPQFVAKHVVVGLDSERRTASDNFRYGSWVVANVHLHERPREAGFPMAWDNVIYGSRSLGYVTSTHQLGLDHGATVLTWYYPLSAVDAKLSRQKLLTMAWEDWAEVVVADLKVPHPDIAPLIRRIDFMRWGHAMVTPSVGFIDHPSRRLAAQPFGAVHFAASDLSGVALMEEAFDHGIRAATEVLQAIGHV